MVGEATPAVSPAQAPAAESETGADQGLLRPISDAEPAGSDPKLSDAFDKLQGEISKLELLSGEEPSWTVVRDGSRTILEQTAKDLRCLMWWSHARFRLEGAAGLQAALAESAGCIKKFAAGLHPKRDKARAAALDWLGARFEVELPLHLKSAPAELLEAVRKSIDEIQSSLEGTCASFEGLYRARTALKGVKAEVPKPAPAAAKPAPAPGAPQPAAAKPAEPVKSATPEGLEDLVELMLERASQLGETALGLRMRRQALWLSVPEGLSGDKHQCESLAPKVRWELEAMCNNKKWPELFGRSEELFPAYPFCLDLTYWSSLAAGELIGPAARDALAGELVALAIRSPKLPRGTDRTGQPLATNATKSYISSLMAPKTAATPATTDAAPAAAAGPAPASTTAAAPAPAAVVTEGLPADVEALIVEKKTAEAVRRASAAAAGLSGRAAFCRHLLLAERLETAGSRELAFPLFRALMTQMRTASLSQWEPLLEARCIRGYLQGARSSKQVVENERELIDTLMLLDPGAAVGLV